MDVVRRLPGSSEGWNIALMMITMAMDDDRPMPAVVPIEERGEARLALDAFDSIRFARFGNSFQDEGAGEWLIGDLDVASATTADVSLDVSQLPEGDDSQGEQIDGPVPLVAFILDVDSDSETGKTFNDLGFTIGVYDSTVAKYIGVVCTGTLSITKGSHATYLLFPGARMRRRIGAASPSDVFEPYAHTPTSIVPNPRSTFVPITVGLTTPATTGSAGADPHTHTIAAVTGLPAWKTSVQTVRLTISSTKVGTAIQFHAMSGNALLQSIEWQNGPGLDKAPLGFEDAVARVTQIQNT